jgi:hypothetical protein
MNSAAVALQQGECGAGGALATTPNCGGQTPPQR